MCSHLLMSQILAWPSRLFAGPFWHLFFFYIHVAFCWCWRVCNLATEGGVAGRLLGLVTQQRRRVAGLELVSSSSASADGERVAGTSVDPALKNSFWQGTLSEKGHSPKCWTWAADKLGCWPSGRDWGKCFLALLKGAPLLRMTAKQWEWLSFLQFWSFIELNFLVYI